MPDITSSITSTSASISIVTNSITTIPFYESTYRKHLVSNNKLGDDQISNIWRNNTPHGQCGILDISSSAEVGGGVKWVTIHSENLVSQQKELDMTGRSVMTRIILFSQPNRWWTQELFGALYDIDLAFFHDVYQSDTGWAFNYTGGLHRSSSPHLCFGYGWVGKIIHCDETERTGPRNVVIISSTACEPRLFPTVTFRVLLVELNLDRHTSGSRLFAEAYLAYVLKRNSSFLAEAHNNPLLFLLPILDVHAVYLNCELSIAHTYLRIGKEDRQHNPGYVEGSWDSLRMLKFDGMGP
ncbi:hypothetical protein M426DRAFT_248903 [Hypoxylon sp. CI-4A]|nr:hypothetical protein M426DRAFT_248903 [Hypoxylon sp. CI-4A]